MKKVLVISRDYSPLSGGSAVYIYSILKRTKKHEYFVLANLAKLSFLEHIKNPKNVRMRYCHLPRIRYLNAFLFSIYSFFSSLRLEFDYIIGNDFVGSTIALFIHLVKRKPLVPIVHNVMYEGKQKSIRRSILKLIFNSSSMIIVNGKKLEDDVYKIFGDSYKHKTVKITPGVEVPPFEKIDPPSKPIILFVGAIYGYKKGIEYIIEAFPEVVKAFDSELWIVGSSKNDIFYNYLKRLARILKVKDSVKFLGRVDNVFSYYDVCEVFVLASYSESETFGIPCIEASAMGKPLVATDILERTGAIVDGKTGIVVPRKNSKRIAEAIIKLLKDKNLRKELGKNGKKYAKQFSWNKSAGKFEDVVERI